MPKAPKNDYGNPPQFIDRLFYNMVLDDDQYNFANAIWNPETIITCVNARSGSGKTTIACGVGNMLVKYGFCDGIVYVASPTQEQKQGYLPGSIEEKSAPYFEPMVQAMIACNMNPYMELLNYDNNSKETNNKIQKENSAIVRCVTHTYFRGTNIENKVVIIDEAQNYYTDELQKVLTRIHDSCKTILIGHTGQCDLYKNKENSGFDKYLAHFQKAVDAGDHRVKVCELTKNYRGWLSNYSDAINNDKWTEEILQSIPKE